MRDWFADHFGTQYAVPRAKVGNPSRWWGYGRDFIVTSAKFALIAAVFCIGLGKALSVKEGQQPVALLFLAALLAALSGTMFSFLI